MDHDGAESVNADVRLEELIQVSTTLARLSREELEGKELSEKDYAWIQDFARSIKRVLRPVVGGLAGTLDERGLRTDIVADVHTDQNSEECLEIGTGKLRMCAVTFYNPEGKLLVGFGPVLSFYEFRHPMRDRLTDEKWQGMTAKPATMPADPEWVEHFTAK